MNPDNNFTILGIENFMSGLRTLSIEDSSDLRALENKLKEYKMSLEQQESPYIEIWLKMEMIEGMLRAIENNSIWYENMTIK